MFGTRFARSIAALGLTAAALFGVAGTAVAAPGAPAGPAIGKIEFCAGAYPAYIHVLPTYSGNMSSGTFASTIVNPWQCWSTYHDTLGQWAQVDVVQYYWGGGEHYLGSKWYNSRQQALHLYGKGTESNAWFDTWYENF